MLTVFVAAAVVASLAFSAAGFCFLMRKRDSVSFSDTAVFARGECWPLLIFVFAAAALCLPVSWQGACCLLAGALLAAAALYFNALSLASGAACVNAEPENKALISFHTGVAAGFFPFLATLLGALVIALLCGLFRSGAAAYDFSSLLVFFVFGFLIVFLFYLCKSIVPGQVDGFSALSAGMNSVCGCIYALFCCTAAARALFSREALFGALFSAALLFPVLFSAACLIGALFGVNFPSVRRRCGDNSAVLSSAVGALLSALFALIPTRYLFGVAQSGLLSSAGFNVGWISPWVCALCGMAAQTLFVLFLRRDSLRAKALRAFSLCTSAVISFLLGGLYGVACAALGALGLAFIFAFSFARGTALGEDRPAATGETSFTALALSLCCVFFSLNNTRPRFLLSCLFALAGLAAGAALALLFKRLLSDAEKSFSGDAGFAFFGGAERAPRRGAAAVLAATLLSLPLGGLLFGASFTCALPAGMAAAAAIASFLPCKGRSLRAAVPFAALSAAVFFALCAFFTQFGLVGRLLGL